MARSGAVWSGWIIFAGIMMLLIGLFDALAGIAAITSEDYFDRGEGRLLLGDFQLWGWLLVAWAVVLLTVGAALLKGREWSRWAAVVIVAINILGHAAFMAFPVWNLLVIVAGAVVLYALTVRWDDAQRDMAGTVGGSDG